ncbi:MAG: MFS transporter, partial [Sandaracinaceae bacterium]|nr:MFS transporter [Sandaracinaceae bacterium]
MALPSVLRGAIAALPVRAGEGRRTALLFAHLLLASAIFILGRTVRDTLFLSRYSLSALPWMFVLYGVASAITVVLYARVADKIPRTRLIIFSLGVGMAAYLGTWVAVLLEQSWIYPVFYVVSEVAANLFIVQFWTLANDLNEPRAARRLFPLIGSARVLGVVVIGLATGAIVRAIGTSQLLLVLVGLMALVAFLALRLGREPVLVRPARKAPKGGASVAKDPYVRVLAAFILCTFVVLTLGDYQFKAIARATYQEDELASFFSLFYAGTGVASFVFQVLVTPRLLRRFGVGWGMRVMPGVFGIASAILLFVPHLAVATVMKFADNGLQYTIHETTLQALYVPFPEHLKARTRAFLDAVIKPLSYGAGGLVLVLLASRMSPYWLSAVAAPVVLAWLLVIPLVRRRYVRALSGTLGVRGALALESMQPVDSDAQSELTKVLEHARPEVLIAALG